jgi:drug/metabolite transporter (DMT)-like permease
VDAAVAASVLAAALLHASWQALVKSSGDGVFALAGMNLVSASVALALLPFVTPPTPAAAVVIAISLLLHSAYKIALAQLYARADLSLGYPLARGLTPIFATLLAFLFLAEVPSAATLGGVIAISLGIAGLMLERGPRAASAASLAAAMIVGLSVAAYTALDAYGVRLNRDWLGFTVWLVIADSALFLTYTFATRRGAAWRQWRRTWGRTLTSGVLGLASYGVFMWALSRGRSAPSPRYARRRSFSLRSLARRC